MYDTYKKQDDAKKQEHLRLFRPNLENPANKQSTKELNEKEEARSEKLKDMVDDTQVDLLDIEQDYSQKFYTAYLNNMRSLVVLFDRVIYKDHFIMLPGDEISEKKHKNVKHLMAMERNEDLGRRDTRSFEGLGAPIFKIDFSKLNPEAYGHLTERPDTADKEERKVPENELNTEVAL